MSTTIKIREPKPLTLGPQRETYRLGHFVKHFLDNHPVFTKDGRGIRSAMRIETAFGLDKAEKFWVKTPELLKEDWDLLRVAVENPPPMNCGQCGASLGFGGYPVRPAKLIIGFVDAISYANEVEPEAVGEDSAMDLNNRQPVKSKSRKRR